STRRSAMWRKPVLSASNHRDIEFSFQQKSCSTSEKNSLSFSCVACEVRRETGNANQKKVPLDHRSKGDVRFSEHCRATVSWLDAPLCADNFQSMKTPRTGECDVPIRVNFGLSDDRRREAAAIEPREQVSGAFFNLFPITGCVGSKQLVPAGLGIHAF